MLVGFVAGVAIVLLWWRFGSAYPSWQEVERAALVVTILGVLGYPIGRWDERRRRKQDTTAIRHTIGIEVGANIQTLETLWADINRPFAPPEIPPATPELGPAIRLAQRDPPRWRRSVWEGDLPRVTEALNVAELAQVGDVYERLDRFDAHRSLLGKPWLTAANNMNLTPAGRQAWDDLRANVELLRREGNPLP